MNLFKIAIIILLLPSALKAQNIIIRDKGGNIVNNDTLLRSPEFTQKPPYTEIRCYLYVQNNSAAVMHMGAKKTELVIGATVEHGICFAKICYVPQVFVSPNLDTVQPSGIDSTFSGHYRYLKDMHTPSHDLVAYTFYNNDNPADSAIVYVIYNSMPATGIETEHPEAAVLIGPNPAGDAIKFYYPATVLPANIVITNTTGQTIISQAAAGVGGTFSLSTAGWANGIYHYALSFTDGSVSNGSFTIAH